MCVTTVVKVEPNEEVALVYLSAVMALVVMALMALQDIWKRLGRGYANASNNDE